MRSQALHTGRSKGILEGRVFIFAISCGSVFHYVEELISRSEGAKCIFRRLRWLADCVISEASSREINPRRFGLQLDFQLFLVENLDLLLNLYFFSLGLFFKERLRLGTREEVITRNNLRAQYPFNLCHVGGIWIQKTGLIVIFCGCWEFGLDVRGQKRLDLS